MEIKTAHIVDLGRGPQLEGHRLTVMDVFYYLHRGYDFDFIRQAMPSLSREAFDTIADYVNEHRAELIEKDRQIEDRIQREIADQQARGAIFGTPDENLTAEQRAAGLKKKMMEKLAEKNGARHPG